MSENLLQTIRLLEQRAQYLEKEAALLRQELAQVVDELAAASPVVARYVIEDETYEITQAEVEAVRAGLAKPHPEEALRELVLAEKVAKQWQKLPLEERNRRFFEAIEAARTAAIADGTALENECEAAIGD